MDFHQRLAHSQIWFREIQPGFAPPQGILPSTGWVLVSNWKRCICPISQTPPWNICTADLTKYITALGIRNNFTASFMNLSGGGRK